MQLTNGIVRYAITGLALVLVMWLVGRADDGPTAIKAGEAVVIIESEETYSKESGTSSVGTGISGPLGLVNDRCVGFVDEPSSTTRTETVIVWPPGTSVEGQDENLQITSEGIPVRWGQRIDADLRTEFPELADVLPADCRGIPMTPWALNS